jgi:hypothetical protein
MKHNTATAIIPIFFMIVPNIGGNEASIRVSPHCTAISGCWQQRQSLHKAASWSSRFSVPANSLKAELQPFPWRADLVKCDVLLTLVIFAIDQLGVPHEFM